MKDKTTVVVVDDERNILTSLGMALESEGYKVRTYGDGASALEALAEQPADIAILDVKMPRMDGMELLRRIRQTTNMPVIFLTSMDEENDELFGLKLGADDYIAKPFSQRLVLERVKAVLRRYQQKDSAIRHAEAEPVLERGRLRLDPELHNCRWDAHGHGVSDRSGPGHPAGRGEVRRRALDAAYQEHACVEDRTIDSHVKRVRREFKLVDANFDAIETLYGIDYRFQDA